jgi:hypothetical protein
VSFLPPDTQRNARRTEELVQQLTESGLFSGVQPQPSEAELMLSIEVVDVNLSTGRTLLTYVLTGGLWSVRVPYRYELTATVRRTGRAVRLYALANEAPCRVWLPQPFHGFGDLVDPRLPAVRQALYRTLLQRMLEDGLLEPQR